MRMIAERADAHLFEQTNRILQGHKLFTSIELFFLFQHFFITTLQRDHPAIGFMFLCSYTSSSLITLWKIYV